MKYFQNTIYTLATLVLFAFSFWFIGLLAKIGWKLFLLGWSLI